MPFPDRRRSPARRDSREVDRFERRRMRSISPDRYRRNSPPYKRHRREDDFYDRHRSPSPFTRGRRESEGYGRRGFDDHPPYHDDYEEGGGKDRHNNQPMSFKEFLYDLPNDDISPEAAKEKYESYLTQWYGSERRAEFERHKNEDWMKDKHDPRRIEEALKRRNENARISAESFGEDITQGKVDPMSNEFGQGEVEIDESKEKEKEKEKDKDEKQGDKVKEEKAVPMICWKEEIIDEDFKLSRELILKLDAQKDILNNPLKIMPKKESDDGTNDGGNESRTNEVADIKVEEEDEKMKENTEEEDLVEEDTGLFPSATRVQKLDLQLLYLWMVHGVDYYAGYELKLDEYKARMNRQRTLRPPQPDEAKECDENQEKQTPSDSESEKAVTEYRENVQKFWKSRMDSQDPIEKPLHKEKVEKDMEDWIESQIIRLNDQKWGSRLSQKLFIEKRYVIKHIKTRQAEAVEQKKQELLDEIYFENYRSACEEQDRLKRERQQAAQRNQEDASNQMDPNDPNRMAMDVEEEAYRRGMPMRGDGMMRGGMPRRGPRGPIMGMGPAFMPTPGPYGPIVFAPPPPLMAPRGGRGGRPRMRPHMPFVMAAPPGTKLDSRGYRDYFDLDAPQNNRAVLDYGDL